MATNKQHTMLLGMDPFVQLLEPWCNWTCPPPPALPWCGLKENNAFNNMEKTQLAILDICDPWIRFC